jgi:membrane protease YdiL (CAAX protease family)
VVAQNKFITDASLNHMLKALSAFSRESIILIAATLLIILECYFLLSPDPQLHVLSVWVYLLIIPVGILFLLGEPIGKYGFAKPVWPFSMRWTIAILALLVLYPAITSPLSQFREYYHHNTSMGLDILGLRILLAALYYLPEEFFFRGFLLFGLRGRVGDQMANCIQAVIFALFHIGKPPLEVLISLPIGYLFGHVTLQTRSFLPSFFMHWVIGILGVSLPVLFAIWL